MDALKTMLTQIQSGDISGDAKILNDFFINPASENDILAQEKAFYGDNVGFFKVGYAGAPTLSSFLGDSDHDFVEAVLTLPAKRESADARAVREGENFSKTGSYFSSIFGGTRRRQKQRRRTLKRRKGSKRRRPTRRGRGRRSYRR
jgi:hypothetical protein